MAEHRESPDTPRLEQRPANSSTNADPGDEKSSRIRVKNRRKHYLDTHPEYFSPSLELADPLLYDRLIRRWQTPAEREAEGRTKGYSGVLEADILRSEAKLEALAHPSAATITYKRGPGGEIYPEDKEDAPSSKEDGQRRWREEMELRFLAGKDDDFDYEEIDHNEDFDDRQTEEREAEEQWFETEEPEWVRDGSNPVDGSPHLRGQTGIQDF